MNIFYLNNNPKVCAQMHNDSHCSKMIIEYAQLMSTAHRVLDGESYYGKTANGRKIQRWLHLWDLKLQKGRKYNDETKRKQGIDNRP